jgi:hypothetical protein
MTFCGFAAIAVLSRPKLNAATAESNVIATVSVAILLKLNFVVFLVCFPLISLLEKNLMDKMRAVYVEHYF